MKELTQKMMFYSVIYQKIIAEVMKRQQMIDPVIVEAMDVEPQPSTSTAHIHASDSEHESDNEGIRRESEGESEVLDDSAFIERNVRSRRMPTRRRARGRRTRQRSVGVPRRRSGDKIGVRNVA